MKRLRARVDTNQQQIVQALRDRADYLTINLGDYTMSENNDFTREKLEGIYSQSHPQKPELPPALEKATRDYFSYRLQLTTGEIIHFSEAELVGNDWVHLTVQQPDHQKNNYYFARGVDVRLSKIVWIQDDGE